MPATSASLLARLRDPGAEEAWARFVQLYTPLLFHWARGTGLQESDAADLVGDVFELLVRKLPQFVYDRDKGFRAWLRTVTLNRWREIRRRREPPAPVENLDHLPDPHDEPFWEADYRSHLARQLLVIMQAEFAPATWKACWECAVEGRSAVEVGRELGLSAGAVRAAKFRVLCRLRRELDGLIE
jgi:RNA polymerase sigma-70 factor (ECF subfamily)